MRQDLRFALRLLGRRPLITGMAIAILALGIAGATSVFSVVYAVILRPLPYHEPDRLVRIWEVTRDGDPFSFSAPNYLDLASQAQTLASVAAFREVQANAVLTTADTPQRITVVPVSASLMPTLGASAQIGRTFDTDDDRPQPGARRLVLSDPLWRTAFGADPRVVGRQVLLDGEATEVIGVMPPDFDFPAGTEAWSPLAADPRRDRDDKDLAVIGRLAAGTTLAQARGELREIAKRLEATAPVANAGWPVHAVPFSEWIVTPRHRDAVWVLFGAVGVLLLLACANVASLLVAQAASRRGELQIRAALGAARRRIARQLFTESVLLAIAGSALGVLLASWSVDALKLLAADRVPRLDGVQINGIILGFASLTGLVSCVFFGLAPALHAMRVDLRSSIGEGHRYTSSGQRLRNGLVVIEVALALLLLVSAGLMANSFARLTSVHPGFDAEGAVAMPIELPQSQYAGDRVATFYMELLDRVRALPGVTAAGASSTNPFRQFGFSNTVTPAERAAEAPPTGLVQADWRSVTPGFFEAMRVPVLSGRTFDLTDRAGGERVVIVSESLAQRLWPDESAIGKHIHWGGTTGRTRRVVGVAGDIRDVQLDADLTPMLFLPHAQVDVPGMTVIVRTADGFGSVAPQLRAVVRDLAPALPPPPIDEIATSRAAATTGPRFTLSLLGTFALIALVLAVSGVYAMLAFTLAERRRELAVRVALGATGSRIAQLVLKSGLTLALTGVAAGAVAAFATTRLLESLLYDVGATDAPTFAAAIALLLGAALAACLIPAWQATRLDAITALKES